MVKVKVTDFDSRQNICTHARNGGGQSVQFTSLQTEECLLQVLSSK